MLKYILLLFAIKILALLKECSSVTKNTNRIFIFIFVPIVLFLYCLLCSHSIKYLVLQEILVGQVSPPLVGVGFLGYHWNSISETPTGEWYVEKDFICMELHVLGSKVPCFLNQSWKRCSCSSNRTKSKANVQSFCSMLQLGLAKHQAS